MPLQDITDKIRDGLHGLNAAAFAVGLEDHREMLRSHRVRVREGHEAAAKALGVDLGKTTSAGEDMGDIIVTGDVQLTDTQTDTHSHDKHNGHNGKKLLAAALLGGAIATAAALGSSAWLQSSPQDVNYQFRLLPPGE
jgi:hypothetical protein